MTRQIFSLLCITLLFTASSCEMGTSKDNKTVKHSKNKDVSMLKVGDKIDISSFEKTDSKILYFKTQDGEGATPLTGETVTVHYTGWLLEAGNILGAKFDSSRDRDDYFQFPVGAGYVIAGWDEMVGEMKVGERRTIILPPNMAYGSRGAGAAIPPNATLVFDVELFKAG